MEIVTFVPGDKADLKPGIKIFIGAAKKLPDGTLQADAADVRTVTLSSDPVEGEHDRTPVRACGLQVHK
jgi:hypothetical protein